MTIDEIRSAAAVEDVNRVGIIDQIHPLAHIFSRNAVIFQNRNTY